MIRYSEKDRLFVLDGKNFSYVLYVNKAGFLQLLHYGGKCGADGAFLSAMAERCAPDIADQNFDMNFNEMRGEYAFYARGDFREPTAVIEREDGAAVSRFRYASHKIYKGVPAIEGMPHARKGEETLEILLKDDFSPAEIVLNYTVYAENDVLVRNAEIKNTGKETLNIKRAFSFCLEFPDADFDLLRLWGTWGAERSPQALPVGHGVTRLHSLRGTSSHQMNPFMGLLRKNCTEDEGECYGVQLIYSGSYALTAEENEFCTLRIQGGINDFNFNWKLGAGETFKTPQAVLAYSNGGLGRLSRSYADFLRENVIDPAYAFKRRPIVVNNWEATYFDFDNEKLYAIIDEAKALGIDTFVLDDGWFGKRDDDRSGLGDWFVNEKKLKGGLKSVIDRCKKNGLKFGLWFEPEMVCEDSELFRTHPDWAIHKDGVTPCRSRNQLILDFSRKEVVDYIYGTVSKILAENDISYVKWDMNRNITECYSSRLPADRQGELMHRYILGVYDLAARLTQNFPHIFFEGCSSGGGRFDAGMLYYFPQIWTSDDTDAFERTKIQWGTSICYPLSSMSCHVSVCPNEQTGRSTPLITRGAVASLGAFGYELDLSKMTKEEKEEAKRITERYKRTDALVLGGDLYRLISPFTDDFFCVSVVAKDKTQAFVVGERLRGVPLDRNRFLRLRGLDENKNYYIEELSLASSGATLLSHGVLLPRIREYCSFVWHIIEK